ncbi:hypothetical protein MPB2EB_1474 [Mycoavidus sp. B2-EB]|nr:hypothetical protein MPB2EB_1474 [Mycoavidus sp. B2-EB]
MQINYGLINIPTAGSHNEKMPTGLGSNSAADPAGVRWQMLRYRSLSLFFAYAEATLKNSDRLITPPNKPPSPSDLPATVLPPQT